MNTSTYKITGLKCASCVAKIKQSVSQLPGVAEVQLDLASARMVVTSRVPLEAADVLKAVQSVGSYEASLETSAAPLPPAASSQVQLSSLTPLFVIVAYLAGAVITRATISSDYSMATLGSNFMGAFFVVFSMFKFFDVRGFADAFSSYDVLASRSRWYALSYPAIELALGLGYFVTGSNVVLNAITATLMFVGAVGVLKALRRRHQIQCACLGSVLKLPMTNVTLVEDVAMGVMALAMLFLSH